MPLRASLKALLLQALLLLAPLALACGRPTPEVHAKVERWAQAFGLDPLLLGAVVWVESRYCPQALGKAGEIGLGQIKPATAMGYGIPPEALYDPDLNLYVAARYLRDLFLRFGQWHLALAAYNQGPTSLAQEGLKPQAYRYALKVLQVYHHWRQALGPGVQ